MALEISGGRIRPIAICLFRHQGRILVFEEFDSVKQDHYCRPLGGGIEFGERGSEAIVREIREELGAEIEDVTWLGTLENIFTLEGQPHHQIVLVYDAQFTDQSLYEHERLAAHEHSIGQDFAAIWRSVDELASESKRLVPEGLLELLKEQETCRTSPR